MTKMSTTTKFLALMPLVVLGAACNGNSPVGPSAIADDTMSASMPNAAAKSIDLGSCKTITAVNLARVPSNQSAGVLLEASYVNLGSGGIRCAAPVWTSTIRGVLTRVPTSQQDISRVRVTSKLTVIVTATAPNGVSASIEIKAPATTLSIGPSICPGLAAVKVSRMRLTPTSDYVIQATYLGLTATTCAAPAFTSNPRGLLTAQPDLFRIGVGPHSHSVTVTATAPNGMSGQILLK
jgi:hypothetical protein